MAKMPDVVATCGCRLVDNGRGDLDLIECEPYRNDPVTLCPTAANILKAAAKAGLDTAIAFEPERRPTPSCTCIAGDGAAECPYVDECLEEWRRQQDPQRGKP